MMNNAYIWEKQPNETSKSFKAFTLYRDLGESRSIEQAWILYRKGKKRVKKFAGYFGKWSTDFNWVSRAQAFDAHQHQLIREKTNERIIDAKLDHISNMVDRVDLLYERWDILFKQYNSLQVTQERVQTLPDGTKEVTKFVGVKSSEFFKLIKGLSDIDSLARRQYEMPDRYIHNKNESNPIVNLNRDVSEMTDDELEAHIRKLSG